jgi:uncharacterized membrane protein
MVVLGVLMRSCQALDEGRDMLADVQKTASLTPLWILGAIAAAMSLALSFLMGMLGLSSIGVMLMSPTLFFPAIGFGFIVWLAASIVMGMALWLAPALVVLKGVAPIEAIKLSLLGTVKNIVPYIVFSLLAMLLCVVAAIPIGLGLLVAFPMLICSAYLAYKDIFGS